MAALAEPAGTRQRIERAGLLTVADAAETARDRHGRRRPPVGRLIRRGGRTRCSTGSPASTYGRSARWSTCSREQAGRRPRSHSRSSGTTSPGDGTSRSSAATASTCSTGSRRPAPCRRCAGRTRTCCPCSIPARLQRAVDQALEEVLGAAEAGKVYVVVAQQLRADRVPMAQVLLMWISEHMPALAERVLASAQARYLAEPAAV